VLQEETAKLDGTVDVLLCDDKGVIFKAIFGMLGKGVENAETRGALLAIRALERLRGGGAPHGTLQP